MRRREFIVTLGGAAAWPFVACTQETAGNLPRIGAIQSARSENSAAFEQGLREAGYVDGQNIVLESRFPGAAIDRLDEVARELVALKCSVIFENNPFDPRCEKSDEHNPNRWGRFGI